MLAENAIAPNLGGVSRIYTGGCKQNSLEGRIFRHCAMPGSLPASIDPQRSAGTSARGVSLCVSMADWAMNHTAKSLLYHGCFGNRMGCSLIHWERLRFSTIAKDNCTKRLNLCSKQVIGCPYCSVLLLSAHVLPGQRPHRRPQHRPRQSPRPARRRSRLLRRPLPSRPPNRPLRRPPRRSLTRRRSVRLPRRVRRSM